MAPDLLAEHALGVVPGRWQPSHLSALTCRTPSGPGLVLEDAALGGIQRWAHYYGLPTAGLDALDRLLDELDSPPEPPTPLDRRRHRIAARHQVLTPVLLLSALPAVALAASALRDEAAALGIHADLLAFLALMAWAIGALTASVLAAAAVSGLADEPFSHLRARWLWGAPGTEVSLGRWSPAWEHALHTWDVSAAVTKDRSHLVLRYACGTSFRAIGLPAATVGPLRSVLRDLRDARSPSGPTDR